MLKSTDEWDQVAAFVALTMRLQVGDSMRVAEAANSHRHPTPNTGPADN